MGNKPLNRGWLRGIWGKELNSSWTWLGFRCCCCCYYYRIITITEANSSSPISISSYHNQHQTPEKTMGSTSAWEDIAPSTIAVFIITWRRRNACCSPPSPLATFGAIHNFFPILPTRERRDWVAQTPSNHPIVQRKEEKNIEMGELSPKFPPSTPGQKLHKKELARQLRMLAWKYCCRGQSKSWMVKNRLCRPGNVFSSLKSIAKKGRVVRLSLCHGRNRNLHR